jgi:RNA polymerase primary sigma factor
LDKTDLQKTSNGSGVYMEEEQFRSNYQPKKSIEKYFKEIEKFNPLNPADEIELTQKARTGDLSAFDKLVEANLRFVISVAKRYQGKGLTLEDLICEGNLGLIEAVNRFDETRGFKFISYAVWWIRQSIFQALAEKSRIIRFPVNHVGVINRVNKVFEKLQRQYGKEPNLIDVVDYLDMTESEVQDVLIKSAHHQSLYGSFIGRDGNKLLDVLENKQAPSPDDSLVQESLKDEIDRILNTLKPIEALIIRLYFGLTGKRRSTLAEIGEYLNLTRERVRQIKKAAIRRLQYQARSEPLKKYLGLQFNDI